MNAPHTRPTAFHISDELHKRYHGDDYVSRLPFIINDTVDATAAAEKLRGEPIAPDRVFMGIAGLRALDLLSVAGSENGSAYRQAVLFDNNQAQLKAMNAVLHLIRHCETPEQFKKEFPGAYLPLVDHRPNRRYSESQLKRAEGDETHPVTAQLREDDNYFGIKGRQFVPDNDYDVGHYLRYSNHRDDSFLQPENYRRIRDLVCSGRIDTITLDLLDEERMDTLRADFEGQQLKLGHVYSSTVFPIMMTDTQTGYKSDRRSAVTDYETSPLKRALTGLGSLGDEETRHLVSLRTPPRILSNHLFSLRDLSAAELENFGRYKADENRKAREVPGHFSSIYRHVGVGRKTFDLLCEKVEHNLGIRGLKRLHPALKGDDIVILVSKADECAITVDEEKRLLAAVSASGHNGQVTGKLIDNGSEEGPTLFAVRLPRDLVDADASLPARTVAALEAQLATLRQQRTR